MVITGIGLGLRKIALVALPDDWWAGTASAYTLGKPEATNS